MPSVGGRHHVSVIMMTNRRLVVSVVQPDLSDDVKWYNWRKMAIEMNVGIFLNS